jgi:hypothetical protein
MFSQLPRVEVSQCLYDFYGDLKVSRCLFSLSISGGIVEHPIGAIEAGS